MQCEDKLTLMHKYLQSYIIKNNIDIVHVHNVKNNAHKLISYHEKNIPDKIISDVLTTTLHCGNFIPMSVLG